MDQTSKKALELHKKYQGKIAVYCKMPVNTPDACLYPGRSRCLP